MAQRLSQESVMYQGRINANHVHQEQEVLERSRVTFGQNVSQ